MNETLFLICPTDCLEARINEQYNTVNYFYTSLGNSFNIDQVSLKNVQELINNHSIKNIYFVLSSDKEKMSGARQSLNLHQLIDTQKYTLL